MYSLFVCLLSLIKFTPVFVCTNILFLFVVWTDHSLFIHLLVDEHLDYFYFLSTTHKAAINIYLQVFVWTYVFIILGEVTRSGVAVTLNIQ